MPTSVAIAIAISSARLPSSAEMRRSASARSAGGMVDQPSKAARAAATAASTSVASPSGMRVIGSSVAAWSASIVPVPWGAVHRPSM